jgi:hypothetical protein
MVGKIAIAIGSIIIALLVVALAATWRYQKVISKDDKGKLLFSWPTSLTFGEALRLYEKVTGPTATFFLLPIGTTVFWDLFIEAICWFGIVVFGIPYYISTWPPTDTLRSFSFVLLMGSLALFYVMAHLVIKPFLLMRNSPQFGFYERGIDFGGIFVKREQFNAFWHLRYLFDQNQIEYAPELIRLKYKSGTYSGFIIRPHILYVPNSEVGERVLELLDQRYGLTKL